MSSYLLSSLILLSIAAAPCARSATPIELKSEKFDLPDSDRMFPGGPGSDAINNNCLACHSADMVLNQPAMPKDAWKSEVNKMISIYKAPIAAEDVTAIVDYLAAVKGTK
jgi:hypothetical protein